MPDDRLRRLSLDELERMANDPGGAAIHNFGWKHVINELIRRIRNMKTERVGDP